MEMWGCLWKVTQVECQPVDVFLIASLFFLSNNLLTAVVVQKQMCTLEEDSLASFVASWESMGF